MHSEEDTLGIAVFSSRYQDIDWGQQEAEYVMVQSCLQVQIAAAVSSQSCAPQQSHGAPHMTSTFLTSMP